MPPATLPPIEGCFRLPVEGPGFQVPIMDVLDERLDPACLGWAQGKPSGVGELRGYLSFADGRAMDPLGLLLAVDSLPPATFDLGAARVGADDAAVRLGARRARAPGRSSSASTPG